MVTENKINWQYIANAMYDYTLGFGYEQIETPWIVERFFVGMTCPDRFLTYELDRGQSALVGSAEQGFLQLVYQNKLVLDKKYVSVGPCFRREPYQDGWHQTEFMKVELGLVTEDADNLTMKVYDMMKDARSVHGQRAVIEQTEIGLDLTICGKEVGSYGSRDLGDGRYWVYGTGLAEPRYSMALTLAGV